MVLWMVDSGGAQSIGGLVWFGVWLGLDWVCFGGKTLEARVAAAAWIGLALVWLVDIRDHGHAHGSRRSELTII
mgnify:CR=1 FL=1